MSKDAVSICMIIEGHYPSIGGAEMQARSVIKKLAEKGYVINVVSLGIDKTQPTNDYIDGIPVHRIKYPHVKIIAPLVMLTKSAIAILKYRKADVIHIHITGYIAFLVGLLTWFIKSKTFTKVSGAYEFDGGLLDLKNRMKLLKRFYNYFIKKVDYVQCISEETNRNMLQLGYKADQLLNIPNGVDVEKFHPKSKLSRETLNVVYIGRLRQYKGIEYLLEAWSIVSQSISGKLILVGGGEYGQQLKKICRDKNIVECVEFVGYVDNVLPYYELADIYVQPSLNEGLPNSVLEAMSCGLPIVATKVSGNEDIVTHEVNGYLVEPRDSAGLSEAIKELMCEHEKRIRFGKKSREFILNNYSIDYIVNRLMEEYRV